MNSNRVRSGERGIALIVALLVMVVLTILGIPFLLMGETENRIAENERLSLQALYAAESGAQMVKRWFDNPKSPLNLANPTIAVIDRTERWIDDGDPGTAEDPADGTATYPYYKQGIDKDLDGIDDVFDKPYRGSQEDLLLGTEDQPDMRIDEAKNSATKTFLVNLSSAMLAGYPSGAAGRTARISLIDVYAPPYYQKSGVWTRFGIGTVKVIARVYQTYPDGTEDILAERMVKMVLNEIPYNPGDLGPLHSCEDMEWGGDFNVHWGVATAMNASNLANNHSKIAASLPRVIPPSTRIDLLWGHDDSASLDAYVIEIDSLRVDDPWLRFMSGLGLEDVNDSPPAPDPTGDQPWPFDWVAGNSLGDGHFPSHEQPSDDGTHSNLFQNIADVGCPVFDYDLWKGIAQDGGVNVHYYVWDPPGSPQGGGCDECFRKPGEAPGSGLNFQDITDDQSGLFFFDTADNQRPRVDINPPYDFTNLTPEIVVGTGSNWGVRGMVYLNSVRFGVSGVSGRPTVFNAPGEPYVDISPQNGRFDTGESYINLNYDCLQKGKNPCRIEDVEFYSDLDDRMKLDGSDGTAADPIVRNPRGPSVFGESNVWGILYTNGYYDNTSNSLYYGTLVAFQGVGDQNATGTADHYWDESLKDNWPPDDWGLPRVMVSRWETDL